MAEFTTIETQEQLDAVIGERIARAKESARKAYEGWLSPEDVSSKTAELNNKISNLNDQLTTAKEQIASSKNELAEKDAKLKAYEVGSVKTKIAHEMGLGFDAIEFLKGEDEESIRESAKKFAGLMRATHVAPLASNDPAGGGDSKKAALKQMLEEMKG